MPGLLVGCYAGAFLEIFSVGRVGHQMALFGGLGLLSGFLSRRVFRESVPVQVLVTCAAYYAASLSNLFLSQSAGEEGVDWGVLAESFSFSQLAVTAFFSPLVFGFLKKASAGGRERPPVWR